MKPIMGPTDCVPKKRQPSPAKELVRGPAVVALFQRALLFLGSIRRRSFLLFNLQLIYDLQYVRHARSDLFHLLTL